MLRRAALAFLFATVCAVSAGDVSESVDFDVISANSDVDKFAQHPETRAEIEQTPDGFRFTYKFGNRSNDDVLVDGRDQSTQWPFPSNFNHEFSYPSSGNALTVTYARIIITVSSNFSQATIIGGGIGQRRIRFRLESRQTLHFRMQTEVYAGEANQWSNYCSMLLLPIVILSVYFSY